MRGLRFILIVSVILAFTSCKTKKFGSTGVTKQQVVELFDKDYTSNTFNSQLQINAGGVNAKGDLRIIKDQTIYLSLQVFIGIEVARIKITQDSLVAIDRFNRRYFADSFSRLKELTGKGINFNALQSLFTNRIFLNGQHKLTRNDMDQFVWKTKGAETTLTPKNDPNCTFTLNADQQLKETTLTDNGENFKLNWDYDAFEKVDQYIFPRQMAINISTPKKKVSSSMQFARIEFGRTLNVDCNIPSRYTRVKLEDILKMFTDL